MPKRREGFELLDASSDSDQEHFSLSQLNNNGKAKERHHMDKARRKKGERCCSAQMSLLFLLVVIVCACVAILAVFTYSLNRKLQHLQAQVDGLVADESGAGAVQNAPHESLQQLADKHEALEAKVKMLQDRDVSSLQRNISILYDQISAMNATVNKLAKANKKQDVSVPNIENKNLFENVANFGSRIQTLEGEYEQLKMSVDEISLKIPMISELVADLDSVNASVTAHFHQVAMTLKQFKNKTDSLDLRLSLVDTKPDSPSLPNIELLVQDALHKSLEDIENLTQAETRTNKAAIERLQEACDTFNRSLQVLLAQNSVTQPTVTEAVDQTKDIPQGALVLALQQGLQDLTNQSHASIKVLNDSVSNLTSRVSILEMAIASKSSAAQLPTMWRETNEFLSTAPPLNNDENLEKTNTDLKEPDADTGEKDTEGSQNGDQPLLSTTDEASPTTTAQDEGFDIEGVDNWEDLQEQFPDWDEDSDGKVTYKELDDRFNDLPPQEYVMSYDDDNDGKLTPEELARAILKDFRDDYEYETDGGTDGDAQQKRSIHLF